MNDRKIRVGILFGGRSAEHEVSIQSARNVIKAIDRCRYEPIPVFIDRQGRWSNTTAWGLLGLDQPSSSTNKAPSQAGLCLPPGQAAGRILHFTHDTAYFEPVDVIFPVLHGPFGEDGTMQGLVKLSGIPCVGSDVLGSAVNMDKDVMKRLLLASNLPTARFLVFRRRQLTEIDERSIIQDLGLPLFVKPANLGSSVGITKVKELPQFRLALTNAFRYDEKVLVEEAIVGREIEVSVLGNDYPIASVPGEVKPRHEFYSYQAKYLDENGADFAVPAQLDRSVEHSLKSLAIKAFLTLECRGMARVDFFLCNEQEILLNEVNTIPGFTDISMYPRLWEASGIPLPELIDRLIHLALERHRDICGLCTNIEHYRGERSI